MQYDSALRADRIDAEPTDEIEAVAPRRILPVVAQVEAKASILHEQSRKLAAVILRDREKADRAKVSPPKQAAAPVPQPKPPSEIARDVGDLVPADYADARTALDRSLSADGSKGIPFLEAKSGNCMFPLWKGHERFEDKNVCGCRVIAGKSWCGAHWPIVFEPLRRR